MLTALFFATSLQGHAFRPPAVPLVAHDPYFSIWSEADHPYDDVTRHWTHAPNGIGVSVDVDGIHYPLIGHAQPITLAKQQSMSVSPTRTTFRFTLGTAEITARFISPLLPSDLEVLSRPCTYLELTARSLDGKTHSLSASVSLSALTVANELEVVRFVRPAGNLASIGVGSKAQRTLGTPGDGTRIDWGYAFLSGSPKSGWTGANAYVQAGSSGGKLSEGPAGSSVLSIACDFGRIGEIPATRHCVLAYDEIYEIKYFGHKLLPYWKRNGDTAEQLLAKAERDYPRILKECEAFDANLMADLTREGGAEYAQLCALAYRQAFAACGIAADAHGQPLMFTKENTSNGDIATVDVIFPMDPMLIALSPALAKATLVPILDYAASEHWKFPNAPHDLGTYPIANGTDDGGEGMPVEESGNMLILCDAISQAEGSATWLAWWWPKLTQWNDYLLKYGYDPEDQLCTDDFMGHLAHNSNLAIKAILGIAAYGDMCRMRGDTAKADQFQRLAQQYAEHWMKVADDGDHTRLAFDRPNTWSQKYNLVWDRILGLNVFPPSLAAEEIAFYKKKLQPYGVPLDSRTRLTKTDWSIWSATLATEKRDFEALIAPIYKYMDTTTNRVPMVDSYITDDIHSDGMHARPVVGGVFIKMLTDRPTWMKWAKAGDVKVGAWAPLPKRPTEVVVLPTSKTMPQSWRFTLAKPVSGWEKPGFDDAKWEVAEGPFGSTGTPGITPNTQWKTDDIWLRREVTMPTAVPTDLHLVVYHDEDLEVYINGVLAGSFAGYQNSYESQEINPEALKLCTPGAHLVIAVHCHQTTGGQGVDVGLVDLK